MERQSTEWEKVFANDVTGKGLISKTNHLCNSIKKQTNKQTNKRGTVDLNRHFSKDDIQMANRYTKRWSTSLIITEMQIITTIRYQLTLVRMVINKVYNNKCWRGCGEKGVFLHYW